MRKQKGYTLVELLITLAITGLLFTVVATVIFQLTTVSGYGNDQLTALHEIQNTTHQLNSDCQSAVSALTGSTLTLSGPVGEIVTYSRAGNTLQRISGTTVRVLAQNVALFDSSSSVNGRLVSVNLNIVIVGRSTINEQIACNFSLRPTPP
jgi:prepilin-type N-terminal cleavage/methylation domain-containing protein